MKLSMKIRAHEAELLVVGADEEQTAEIIRIMLQGCTAEVPSRLPAEVPRRLCAGGLALPATTTPRRCPWCWLPYRALAGKLCSCSACKGLVRLLRRLAPPPWSVATLHYARSSMESASSTSQQESMRCLCRQPHSRSQLLE